MNGNMTGLRIISAVVLLAAIAGIAYLAFQAGVVRGSPITLQAPSGEAMPYGMYGHGMPFHRPFGFGFGLFGFLILLFLFFTAMRAFGFLMWGSSRGWSYHHGPWQRFRDDEMSPLFEEWHKRAHGESPEKSK